MAQSLNEVTLLGNLGEGPDIRQTMNGNKVANFPIATNEVWKKDGVKHERTEWHRIAVFGDGLIKKLIEPYVTKGSKVLLRGSLRTRKWTDQNGQDRYSTEIVVSGRSDFVQLLSSGSDRREDPGEQHGDYPPPAPDLDDEIPF